MPFIEAIIKTFAPHNCLVCGQEGTLICLWCKNETFTNIPSRCYNCYAITENSAVCIKCRRLSPLRHVWVRTEYDGIAKQIIQSYKFRQARAAAPIIAEFMSEILPYLQDTTIVPVPTASSRIRQRGFDHASLIAKNLSGITEWTYAQVLRRSGQTKQVGTKRAERKSQLNGTFRATENLIGQRVLLVDDVVTTGATLEEAARVCRQAGAKTVDAVVFAQRQ